MHTDLSKLLLLKGCLITLVLHKAQQSEDASALLDSGAAESCMYRPPIFAHHIAIFVMTLPLQSLLTCCL